MVTGVDVPNWLLGIVEDDILRRRLAAKFWSEQRAPYLDEGVKDNNERHMHFIHVLEEVLEILKSVDVIAVAGPSNSRANSKQKESNKSPYHPDLSLLNFSLHSW
jgi:hypothetical protein